MFFIKLKCKIDLILLHTSCHYLRCELHNCRNLVVFFISDLAVTRQRAVTVSEGTVIAVMTVLRGVSARC